MSTRTRRRPVYRRYYRHGALCRWERRVQTRVAAIVWGVTVGLAQLGALVLLSFIAALAVAATR